MRYPVLVSDFIRAESGQGLAEYAFVAAVVALGVVAGMTGVRNSISTILSTLTNFTH